MLLECPVCKKEFSRKPSAVKKIKHTPCCSKKCSYTLRKEWMRGEGNHQKGLIGKLNSSFKTDITIMKRGTKKYEFRYAPWHPFAESTGRVRNHRLVVENYWLRFDSKYFNTILCKDGQFRVILNPKYDVHHKDGNTLNNSIDNLVILTRGEHTRIHNKFKNIVRDKNSGKIIGIIKSGELLETPEVDNQQPSVENDIRVSTTVQRLGGEESTNNPPTSARLTNADIETWMYQAHKVMMQKLDDIVWPTAITLYETVEVLDKEPIR